MRMPCAKPELINIDANRDEPVASKVRRLFRCFLLRRRKINNCRSHEVTVTDHPQHEDAKERVLHDGFSDKLVPLDPLDLSKVKSVDDLVRAMGNTSFTGRQVGQGADVVEAMARDKDCFIVMTLAGAMTAAKQGLIITDLIDAGVVNAVISTGALMAHGLVEAAGRSHFRYDERMDDTELYEAGYNRVYD